jgi:hypothetical protein
VVDDGQRGARRFMAEQGRAGMEEGGHCVNVTKAGAVQFVLGVLASA